MNYLYTLIFILFHSIAIGQNLTSGLQAHYTFDGNLQDATSNGYHLQNGLGSISYTTISGTDQAIYFDSFDRVDQIGSLNNSSWTSSAISLWIKTSTTNSLNQFIIQGAYMGFGIYINSNDGKLAGFFENASQTAYLSPSNIADGNWHHIVYQTDGTTIYLYIDGIFIGSQPHTLITGNGGSNNKLYFGQAIISPRPYTGFLNNCRIYNRMLSTCEIQTLAGISGSDVENFVEVESCENYYWTNTDETYTSTGMYSDTLQTTEGCDSIVTLDLTIHSIDTNVTVTNGMLTSNENGANTYQWINCLDGNIVGYQQSYSPTNNGSFSVIITTDHCVDTSGCYTVKGLNIPENESKRFYVYKSPLTHFAYIEIPNFESGDVILIKDVLGKTIFKEHISNHTTEVRLPEKGIFLIEVHIGNIIQAEKIINF